ncbi:MAG: (2Fe-2S)-binding protein [Nitrospinae bacterium]|nr:(2Fe-2S)-binding protein [Nitrospinota bacterium]
MSGHADIVDNLKLICQCKGIKKGTFKKLMAEGTLTHEGLKKATGAGSGQCGGARCAPRILAMLEERK